MGLGVLPAISGFVGVASVWGTLADVLFGKVRSACGVLVILTRIVGF